MKKQLDASSLREACLLACPDLVAVILHDSEMTSSTWKAGIETGKAVEMLALCALVSAIRYIGHSVLFPELYTSDPDLFYLRNSIPRHHGAQAGHEVVVMSGIPLVKRFEAALTPKAIIKTNDGRSFLMYREGHPIHFISNLVNQHPEYLDRPDIVIAEGDLVVNTQSSAELPFIYNHPNGIIQGSLRVKNDIKVPLISFEASGSLDIPINGIIECSVGKGKERAEDQLSVSTRPVTY